MAHLLLMGLRGCGKTTLAPPVAARLGLAWRDLDEVTKTRLGARTVAEAWAKTGEAGFRAAEFDALRDTLAGEEGVLALGGGTLMNNSTREWFGRYRRARPVFVAYLRITPGVQRARLAQSGVADRPSLTGRGVLEELDDVFAARDPVYRSLADEVFECDSLPIERTAELVVSSYGSMLP